MCQFIENDFLDQRTYQVTFFISSYLLPLTVISGLYVLMIMRLWRQGSGVRMSKESQRGRKRVTRLVVVVVVAFASLWLPIQVSQSQRFLNYICIYVSINLSQLILLLKTLDLYAPDTSFTIILQIVSQIMAYTSSCINPLLYAFLSENFRKAFYKVGEEGPPLCAVVPCECRVNTSIVLSLSSSPPSPPH